MNWSPLRQREAGKEGRQLLGRCRPMRAIQKTPVKVRRQELRKVDILAQ
jgi:hypothetical protein